ncbi:DinB family protein [Paenibacillus sp. JX-17]|uniref:DinB family protein n=1 Tax=Paenibacillus lacisoli TaxID=3064525 RepID=A0ABT9CF26_9BACL|nr:DinB family protein [Paenibacillus sp. JX-17]MDO7907875.1 DinB family protein [Paenibacillus sp. JX-17]
MHPIELFPYRNDIRTVLLPYLQQLPESNWFRTHSDHPNSVAWIIQHISDSEASWLHTAGLHAHLDRDTAARNHQASPAELIDRYIRIRLKSDRVLRDLSITDLKRLIELPKYSDGWTPPSPPTLRWVFHHIYEHEAYHAGQIGVIARLNGFAVPLF